MPEPDNTPREPLSLPNSKGKVVVPTRRQELFQQQFEQYNIRVRRAKELRRQQQKMSRNPKVITKLYYGLCSAELFPTKPKKVEGIAIDVSIPVWRCRFDRSLWVGYGTNVSHVDKPTVKAIVSSLELP